MYRTTSLICFLSYSILLLSQEESRFEYPDGVYANLEDFMAKNPDTVISIRKVNLDVDLSKAFLDTLVDRCFFIDANRDQIKKIFAVVHHGQIYFQEYAIRKHLASGNRKQAKNETYYCYRVLEGGPYMYCKVLAVEQGYYGGGLLGAALADLGPAVLVETGIVFHPKQKKFYAFNNCVQFEYFVKVRHPDFLFSCERQRLVPDEIRTVIHELNLLVRN